MLANLPQRVTTDELGTRIVEQNPAAKAEFVKLKAVVDAKR